MDVQSCTQQATWHNQDYNGVSLCNMWSKPTGIEPMERWMDGTCGMEAVSVISLSDKPFQQMQFSTINSKLKVSERLQAVWQSAIISVDNV
jgi:hypothetical protein